ncbi:MAG TPA: gliding motility protein GldM [Bacteroidia bacterium]|jgi:gliding motility-associated protein GldM|nr:gliding motility protein GldM [Bacteroidia bacterium]
MAGGKETPRQKMIGMMYLVLTALLAMNVSKDILKAFVTVNESLERTNKNFSDNTVRLMKAFEEAKKEEPKAIPYYNKAIEAKKLTQELYEHMEKLKHTIIADVEGGPGGDTLRLRYLEAKDNYDIPTHKLIGDDERQPVKGQFTAAELRDKIQSVHDKLINLVKEMQKNKKTELLKADYDALLSKIETMKPVATGETEDDVPVSWEMLNFYHLPTAGVITNVSKMQADLKNIEGEIISQFSTAAGKMLVKFNRLNAEVVAQSSYVQSGEPYNADIFLAASSTDFKSENMQVIINPVSYDTVSGKVEGGTPLPLVNGVGKLKDAKGVGDQDYKGVIRFKQPNGEFKLYPFEQKYTVAAPSVAVSPEKMNVFYIGVDNPVAISAAGIAPANLLVTASGGGITLKPNGSGKYIVKASTETKEGKINVAARGADGGVKAQGSCTFRVKFLPNPVASVGGKKGFAEVKRLEISGMSAVIAKLENFDFETTFKVTSFDLTAIVRGQPVFFSCKGSVLTDEMKAALSRVSTGSRIFFDNVIAVGPDGKVRNLPGVTLKVRS